MPRTSHIRGLDGIRAVAFFLVLGGHCGFFWIPNGFGVTVFFFLSGYLITTLLRQEWSHTGSLSVSHFYIRRAFRILPPFLVALIFGTVLALGGVTASQVHWKAVTAALLFLTNYSALLVGATVPAGLTVLWSLAVEEHFYLIFPRLYRGLLRRDVHRHRQVLCLGCICFLALAWRTILMTVFHAPWFRVYSGTDTRLDSILFGSIMAIAINPAVDNLTRLTKRQCASAALVGLVILIVSIAVRGEIFRQTIRYTVQAVALLPCFLFVVRYPGSAVTRWLEWRFLVHIGELSYSLYLVHAIILTVVHIWVTTNPVVSVGLALAASYVIAWLVRRHIELPSYKMRDRVLRQLEKKRIYGTTAATA